MGGARVAILPSAKAETATTADDASIDNVYAGGSTGLYRAAQQDPVHPGPITAIASGPAFVTAIVSGPSGTAWLDVSGAESYLSNPVSVAECEDLRLVPLVEGGRVVVACRTAPSRWTPFVHQRTPLPTETELCGGS
jgi:hypothetical protein